MGLPMSGDCLPVGTRLLAAVSHARHQTACAIGKPQFGAHCRADILRDRQTEARTPDFGIEPGSHRKRCLDQTVGDTGAIILDSGCASARGLAAEGQRDLPARPFAGIIKQDRQHLGIIHCVQRQVDAAAVSGLEGKLLVGMQPLHRPQDRQGNIGQQHRAT